MSRRSCLGLLFPIMVVTVPGCVDTLDGGTLPPPAVVNLPAPIGEANFRIDNIAFQPSLQWSPDGGTIYYLPDAPQQGVKALDLTTGVTRLLAGAPNTSYQLLRISADGATLFYSSLPHAAAAGDIYRVPTTGGLPELLVEGALHVFAISPDGRMLGWRSAGGGLFVRDLETNDTQAVAGSGLPLLISADHDQLLHGVQGQWVHMTSLTSGEISDASPGMHVLEASWTAQGLQLLGVNIGGSTVMRSAHDEVWSPPTLATISGLAWSHDGAHIGATVTTLCPFEVCQRDVVLIDASTHATSIVARANSALGRVQFSPDGRFIAVTNNQRLYVLTR